MGVYICSSLRVFSSHVSISQNTLFPLSEMSRLKKLHLMTSCSHFWCCLWQCLQIVVWFYWYLGSGSWQWWWHYVFFMEKYLVSSYLFSFKEKLHGRFPWRGFTTSYCEEAVYFLPPSSQKFLVLIWSTPEGWKAELTLDPSTQLFWALDPWIGNSASWPLGHCALNTRPLLHYSIRFWNP